MKKSKMLFWLAGCMLAVVLAIGAVKPAQAGAPDEGMWLPMFIEDMTLENMEALGLRITPEMIYSINNSSIKDAIVGLSSSKTPSGFFCTAEVVSDKGLLFTNHHCGYDIIQQHSTIEHDYLKDGFWAMSLEEELMNENLTATFFIRMEDVTDSIMPSLSDTMSESDRSAEVRQISDRLKKAAAEDGRYHVVVKDFFGGSEFYLFVYEVFQDVRLVGAPPSSIGKYGGDTDNWMWPRHTGDFSIFRVYTAPDGSSAAYSEENVPMKPKYHLPVSLDGVEEGDFAMIWGYPGSTDRYLSSYGVNFQVNHFDPYIVDLLGAKLEVWRADMDADREVAIKYASKYASLANGWKYFIGEARGLKRLDVEGQKRELEKKFQAWVNEDPVRQEKYGDVLAELEKGYSTMGADFKPLIYTALGANGGPEIFELARNFNTLKGLLEEKDKTGAIEMTADELQSVVANHFENYNSSTDMKVFARMMELYYNEMPKELLPEVFVEMVDDYNGDFDAMAADYWEETVFSTEEKAYAFLDNPKFKTLDKDPILALTNAFSGTMMKVSGNYGQASSALEKYHRLFIAGLREMHPDKAFYPDANSTMRFTYGTVQPYKAADAVYYDYKTHLSGVMEKEDPSNEEFIVPDKLKELYKNKDFGPYGEDGRLVTCFLTTNDITGGNSGSPVLNGSGELIGLAFDGNWEAMSGNIAYEPNLQRTICVDIRYVLFVIDKYAGAQNLIDELTFAPYRITMAREDFPGKLIKIPLDEVQYDIRGVKNDKEK
jgi:hypothetical protein